MKPIYKFLLAAVLQQVTLYSISAQADLSLSIPQPIYDNAFWNSTLYFNFDLHNQGNLAAQGNFNVKSALSLDEFWSPDDYFDGVVPTGNLSAGQSINGVLGGMTITAIPEGNYYLLLKADADEVITETDETNNTTIAGFFNVQNPDKPNLTCAINFAGWSNVNTLNMVVQVSNFTLWNTIDSFSVSIYGSNSNDLIQKIKVAPLASYGSANYDIAVVLPPASLANSPYDFWVFVDSDQQINEIDEYNNTAQYSLEVPAGLNLPDYALSLTAPLDLNGETIDISFRVRNIGGGIAPEHLVQFALRSDSTYDWYTRYPLGTFPLANLSTGAFINGNFMAQLPPVMKTGHYYIEIIAGADLNSNNNQLLAPFDFQSPFTNPEHILLGEGTAKEVRQNTDQSYTVLLRTPNEHAQAVQVSPQGNIIGSVDLGLFGAQTTFDGPDAYIALQQTNLGIQLTKINTQGGVIWTKNFPQLNYEIAQCVATTTDGGYLIGGTRILPNPNGPSSQLPFLLRTDGEGNELWRRETGPLAGSIQQLTPLPNGDFGAVVYFWGYIEQKYGFEIHRISSDGLQFSTIDGITASYQGTFSMFVSSLKSNTTDTSLYYASNHWGSGKWTNYYYAYFAKTNAFKTAETACGGVCVPQGYAAAHVLVPSNDGGGLALGENGSAYNHYNMTKLDAQGHVVWRRPYPQKARDGVQNTANGFAICGDMGAWAYLTLIGADGNPENSQICLNDTVPPILTSCPPNISLQTVGSEEYLSWNIPQVADNCGAVTIISNVEQGYFGIGAHHVMFTATDMQGNTATCAFVATIEQVPCFPAVYYAFCSDNQTPTLPEDDILTLYLQIVSPDNTTWEAFIEDMPTAAPLTGAFNTGAEFVFPLSEIGPFLLDSHLVVHFYGQNGNLCDYTLDIGFQTNPYCTDLIQYTDIALHHLQLPNDSAATGASFAFYFDVHNTGNKTLNTNLTNKIILSTDTQESPDDWTEVFTLNYPLPANDSIVAQTATLHIPSAVPPGNYYLLVKADTYNNIPERNETDNTVVGNITITAPNSGVTDWDKNTSYRISPNPFGDQFVLTCTPNIAQQALHLRLYNSNGTLVFEQAYQGQPNGVIRPGNLPAGVYFLEITDSKGVYRQRMVH